MPSWSTALARVLAVALLLARPAAATQPLPPDSVPSAQDSLYARLLLLGPHRTLRILLRDDGSMHGDLAALDRTSLSLATGDSLESVGLESIEGVWVGGNRARDGAVAGLLLGALVLGVTLGYFVIGMSSLCFDAPCNPPGHGAQVGLLGLCLVIGGGAGALIGTAVGSALPRWDRLHPPDPQARIETYAPGKRSPWAASATEK